jgi:hypothetical protein
MIQMTRIIRFPVLVIFPLAALLCACGSHGPYRVATEPSQQMDALCGNLYDTIDNEIEGVAKDYSLDFNDRMKKLALIESDMREKTSPAQQVCWQTSYEKHSGYDLFYAEFDDSGEPTDLQGGKNVTYATSELHLIKSQLKRELAAALSEHSGLNIVLFTHGWHGSARALDDYSLEFKGILQEVSYQEQQSQQSRVNKNIAASARPRRTVGIEIAWRGDSFLNPAIPFVAGSKNFANVWDRKITAKVISSGSAHALFAFLNEFYRENSCDEFGSAAPTKAGSPQSDQCDAVHMLTIGHSFGALINLHALVSRIDSGLNVPPGKRAFGFGDMSVLLNPAVEGTSYRGLFETAINRKIDMAMTPIDAATTGADARPYLDGTLNPTRCETLSETAPAVIVRKEAAPGTPVAGSAPLSAHSAGRLASMMVQMPTLVILQSHGDSATGTFFPPMQGIAALFRQTLSSQERVDKTTAVGWIDAYRTHKLALSEQGAQDDSCSNAAAAPASFCPFIHKSTDKVQFVTLSGVADRQTVPDFMPLWSIMVDDKIMEQHDDFWNPQIVRLISALFRDAYEQSEHRNLVRSCEAQKTP